MRQVEPYEVDSGITDVCVAPINHACEDAALWIAKDMFAAEITMGQDRSECKKVPIVEKILPQVSRLCAHLFIQLREDPQLQVGIAILVVLSPPLSPLLR
jgi:hypothetical protein